MKQFRQVSSVLFVIYYAFSVPAAQAESPRIKALFLGDNGHHRPIERAADLIPPLAQDGIDVAYTDDLADLNPEHLSRYDALIIYANHERISPDQEAALLDFVESGNGLVAIHCASYCFLNSPQYIALVGGQFQSHGGEVFRPRIVADNHPALKGVEEFEAWDETYVHHKLSDDRDVLMYRVQNGHREPWTWTRRQGRGRVFYTASGHDERVFRNPGFHRLIVQGIRWAVGRPDHRVATASLKRLPAELPNYIEGAKWGTTGEPIRDMQAPLSAEESLKHISVPGGFDVELFAAEPEIVNPIAITWDARGRAWIAETVDYPNDLQPEGQGHDRIKICEDTDGDGRADQFTVFAENLSVPTSLVHISDGVIIAQAPHMLLLRDTDGDDRADVRKVLLTGFSTRDTHAGPSNLRLGLDNWIYATIGYSGFEGTVGGERHSFRQGIFRFKPDGSQLEYLTSSSNNTWGLGISETGEILYSTANGEHSSYMAIPNRYFESVRGWLGRGNARMADHRKMHPITTIRQVDHHGGFTAAAGHALYTARQFPSTYWNRMAFVCEPTGHLVHMCLLERDGSHFVSRDRFNFFASTDEWTAPIAAEVGPDGAVWILDWYNYVVQHNPTPPGFETGKGNAYVTPLRDRKHARIYRVVNSTTQLSRDPELTNTTPAELVAALQSDNMFWRLTAQWQLVRRNQQDVLPKLAELVESSLDKNREAPAALHALWTMNGLRAFDEPADGFSRIPIQALGHPAASIRRAAVRVLPRTEAAAQAILDRRLLADNDPLVRRAALLTLAEMPAAKEVGAAVYALLKSPENASDRWIPLAATSTAARHDVGFLTAALQGGSSNDAVRASLKIVAEHYARRDAVQSLPDLLKPLQSAPADEAEAFLAGLSAGWPKDRVPELNEPAQTALATLMGRLSAAGQSQLASLAQRWKLTDTLETALAKLRQQLTAEVGNPQLAEKKRIEAARRLAQFNPDRATLDHLLDEVTAKASPSLASEILAAAGQTTSAELGTLLVNRWRQFTPQLRQQALEILLQRPEWSRTLLDGLEANQIAVADLGIDQAQRLTRHPDQQLAARARKILESGTGLPSPNRQKVLEELLPLAQETGDATKGFEVFKKNCAKCHRHGETGETIGPNLTGFAVHPKDKILSEILDPNRSVEGNFRQYTIVVDSGRVFSGLLASETRTALELVDTEAKKHVILRDEIIELIASDRSIMPEGFEKQISRQEFVDLLEFLTTKGKYFPLPLDKAATIVSTQGMFHSKDSTVERLIFPDWKPKTAFGVRFQLIDPQQGRVPNVILLKSPNGTFPPQMPESVSVPCNTTAQAIHLLSGVSGWGHPLGTKGSVSLIVRLHYADGQTEDHPLRNGEHFADYIRRVDVPGSKLAFMLRDQQIRYLAIHPKRRAAIETIEFVKGPDRTAPVVMAVTVETEE